ncbi:phage portal protein [Anaerovoracaceae bacterium SGI.195]
MGVIKTIKNALTKKESKGKFEMISMRTGSFFSYEGRLYESDVIRAAIRPKARAIGKATAKHIQRDQKTKKLKINEDPRYRFLLEEPNEYMSGQMFQEKMAVQLELNNNAFAFIERAGSSPIAMYPIDCRAFEMQIDEAGELYIKFLMYDGKYWTGKYSNIIHLRKDYGTDVFLGSSPGKTLTELMNVVSTMDQGLIHAIKNSTIIRWLLKFNTALKTKDLESRAKEFAKTYTATETETGGVAAVGADADVIKVDTKDYVPNALQNQNVIKRVYAYFNTNEKIIHSDYTEDEWISYFENAIEPDIIQFSNEMTRKLFTRKERSYENQIKLESSNLAFASMQTKLQLVQFVDRGMMTPNEVREILGYAPVDGGDVMVRRLDTAPTRQEDNNGD